MKQVVIILAVLAIILLILIYFNNNDAVNDHLIFKFDKMEEIIPDISIFQTNTIHTKRNDTFQGIPLINIMASVKISEEDYSSLVFHTSDGGSLAVGMNEINDLYLVEITKDKENYLRLVIPTDDFPQRWMKYISLVEFLND